MRSDVSLHLNRLKVAVGLYREGTELEGLPGNSNSFAYQGDGQLCHNVGSLRQSRIVQRDYATTFGVGDIVGCGWNIRSGELYFTKNGEYLGSAFDSVQGRFYPVIWLEAEHVKVEVNFGQEPFVFAFVKTLPDGYLTSLQDQAKNVQVMSAAEIRRRTQAEELMMMVNIYSMIILLVTLL